MPKVHRSSLTNTVSDLLQFCKSCGGCKGQGECSCRSSRCSSIRPDDGSRYDSKHWLASVLYGYVEDTPIPASALFTITPILNSEGNNPRREYQLAPGPLATQPLVDAAFGFDEFTKVGELLAIANLAAPNDIYNTIFEIKALPTLTSPWYVIKEWNPFNACGLRAGDYIEFLNGIDTGIWFIELVTTTAPKTMTLALSNYESVALYQPIIVIAPQQCGNC